MIGHARSGHWRRVLDGEFDSPPSPPIPDPHASRHAPPAVGSVRPRQPSSGATYLTMLSIAGALYSTPCWLGTVRSRASAAAIAVSWSSSLTTTSGSAAD